MAIPARRDKDRWHQLADLIQDSNLPASDKSVFRYLLDRSNYGTGELAARFAPLQATIGRKTSHSPRQVRYATRHLERHGWLAASRNTQEDSPDRRRLRYELAFGGECDCVGRVHDPTTGKRQPQAQVAATTDTYIAATDSGNAAGQQAVPTERQREEGSKGGRFERKPAAEAKATSARLPPDWPLIRQLVRIVHDDPCGGIHRDELAERLHLPASSQALRDALGIAYKTRKIDFVRNYVVKPVPIRGRS